MKNYAWVLIAVAGTEVAASGQFPFGLTRPNMPTIRPSLDSFQANSLPNIRSGRRYGLPADSNRFNPTSPGGNGPGLNLVGGGDNHRVNPVNFWPSNPSGVRPGGFPGHGLTAGDSSRFNPVNPGPGPRPVRSGNGLGGLVNNPGSLFTGGMPGGFIHRPMDPSGGSMFIPSGGASENSFPGGSVRPGPSFVVNNGGSIRNIDTTSDVVSPSFSSSPIGSSQRYNRRHLKLQNPTQGTLKVYVRYRELDSSGNWQWVPALGLPEITYTMKPGQEAVIANNNIRVLADRVRMWAKTETGQTFEKYRVNDLVLGRSNERDANGDLSYVGTRYGTFTYRFK